MSLPCEKFLLRIAVPPGIWDVTVATAEWNSTNPCEFPPSSKASSSLLKDAYPGDFNKWTNHKSANVCKKPQNNKKETFQSKHFGLGRISATIMRAVWIVRFCWKSLWSKWCLVQHERKKWKEGEEPAEEVGSYPGAGTQMGRGRVRGRVGG